MAIALDYDSLEEMLDLLKATGYHTRQAEGLTFVFSPFQLTPVLISEDHGVIHDYLLDVIRGHIVPPASC